MCVCVYVCMCVCVYVCMCVCVYVCMCVCVYVSMCLCVYVCMCACVCVCVYMCVVCVCMCVCVCVYTYIYIYIRTSTHGTLQLKPAAQRRSAQVAARYATAGRLLPGVLPRHDVEGGLWRQRREWGLPLLLSLCLDRWFLCIHIRQGGRGGVAGGVDVGGCR